MIAITGAAGFIGSNLAHALSDAELLLVDHPLTVAKPANWVGLSGFTFLDHERFLGELDAGRVRPSVIYHLGACSATTETRWDYLERNNIGYTRRLWSWCAVNGVPFVYASSAATYGDGSLGFDDRTPPTALQPLNLYGKSKNDFDIWALAEAEAGRLTPPTWAGVKFFNVYGPREDHKGRMASVVRHAYRSICETGAMKLFRSTDPKFADGGQQRDFVYVNDCVSHMIRLAQGGHANGLYNSGTGTARTFADLVTATFRALGKPVNITFIDMPPDLAKQYQNYTQAVMTRLHALENVPPPTTLEAGVTEYVMWLIERYSA